MSSSLTTYIASTSGLVEVDVDALQLQIGVTMVGTRGVNTWILTNMTWENV
jgi:hypothetical protein